MAALEKGTVAREVVSVLSAIIGLMEAGEYIQAESMYYDRLGVGKNAWPLGVAMPGIHERKSRGKITPEKVASTCVCVDGRWCDADCVVQT